MKTILQSRCRASIAAIVWSLLGGLLFVSGQVFAQMPEPREIGELKVEFQGARNVSEENVFAHILLRRGQNFDQGLADQSIRALYESGNFDYIEISEMPQADGTVTVIFEVTPKYRVREVLYEGLEDRDPDDFEEDVEIEVGGPLDPVQVKRDSVAIFDYLQERGYFDASVTYDIERDDRSGTGIVTFRIKEGRRYKIDDIKFEGNANVDSGDLRDEMETSEYIFLWSWITGSGRLQRDVIRTDLETLRNHYRDLGFLDVQINDGDVRYVYGDGSELDVIIPVVEGRRYTLGTIEFKGNTLIETNILQRVAQLKTGNHFSPTAVREAANNLKDHYGQFGYLDTFIRVERAPDTETGTIDLTFNVREGDVFFVESISIQGNIKTKSEVILRELALAPGDTFDLIRMKASEARLKNTRFFDNVNLSPEATNIPARRNLRVNVSERETGELSFGAGFSSLSEITAFLEFKQSNFDIFSHRTWFQGGGQKFRIRLAVGTASSSFILSFEEPWIFNRRMAFGFELFRNETDYVSTVYNELRMGFEVYLRRRLFELVQGRLSYRLEQVEIMDVDANVAPVIAREEGSRSVSKVGWLMSRDSRDRYLWTTSGSRISSNSELAGLGGQTYYINQEFRATKFFLFFEDPFDQTLMLHARTGTIFGYNDRSVPFFDRYFLGGPYTLRGFDFRDVGPKDPAFLDPTGGNTMAMAQVEYLIRFVEPIGIAGFYDVGFVNDDKFDWDPTGYNDNWGVGARIAVMGAPLNLDFAWPITSDDFNDGGMQFNFSFGTTF